MLHSPINIFFSVKYFSNPISCYIFATEYKGVPSLNEGKAEIIPSNLKQLVLP